MATPRTKQAALYARVSTKGQATEDSTSLPDQLRRCRQVCAQHGWEVYGEYEDPGVSGEKLAQRPEMMRLLADAEAGHLDVVVAVDLDRIARDEFVFAQVFRALDRAEVAVHADGNLIDPENLSNVLTRGIKAVVSAHDRRALVQKMAKGQRARGLAGGWPGGKPPYGYRLAWPESTGSGKPLPVVQIDEAEAEMLRVAIGAIVDEGYSTGQAAQHLNALGYRTRGGPHGQGGLGGQGGPWGHQNLRRVLSSRTLVGELEWGKPGGRAPHRTKLRRDGTPWYGDTVRLTLAPLIEPVRYEALQLALAQRAYGVRRPDQPYPNSGAASLCGGRLGGVYRRDRDLRQYRCNRSKWTATGAPRCDCLRLEADWLDGQVWDAVTALLSDPRRLLALADEYLGLRGEAAKGETDQLAVLDRKITELEHARVDSARDALKAGLDPELIRQAVEGIEAELAALVGRRDRVQAVRADEQAQEARAVAIARLAQRAGQRLPEMALGNQREVLALLQVRVSVLDNATEPALQVEGELPGGGDLFGDEPLDVGRGADRAPTGVGALDPQKVGLK